MGIIEVFLLGISLSMDAFAVAICKGLCMKKIDWKKAIIIGIYFGIFQGGMPVIGYFLGTLFEDVIISVDHWIAFVLLAVIGGNMINEAFKVKDEDNNDSVNFRNLVVLALATSIDALAIGITFAFLNVNVPVAVTIIGLTTFSFSLIGVKIGNKFGNKYEKRAQIAGGTVLIILGIKILLEHLGILKIVH